MKVLAGVQVMWCVHLLQPPVCFYYLCRYCGGVNAEGNAKEPFVRFKPQYIAHRYPSPMGFGALDLFVVFQYLGLCDTILRTYLYSAGVLD